MSSNLDIFDRLSGSSGDIFDRLSSGRAMFGEQGQLVGGSFGKAIETGIQAPEQVFKELPVAAAKTIEYPITEAPKFIGSLVSKLLGHPSKPGERETFLSHLKSPEKTKIASEILADYVRENLPEHLKGGAEEISNIESMLLPFLKNIKMPKSLGKGLEFEAKPSGPAAPSGPSFIKEKIAPEFNELVSMVKERLGLKPKEAPETFQSGLTKHKVVGTPHAEKAIISKERQKQVIGNLDKEAQDLARKTVTEKVPLTKKIEEGFDFRGHHEREFGKLKSMAEKANPEIDITPMSKFFSDTRKKYRGIPKLHSDATKIMQEIRAFGRRPESELGNLLRIYRSNNRKRDQIFERARLLDKQKEYDAFLGDMNRKIVESIEKTLPEDSEWLKQFKDMNAQYSQFKNAEGTMRMLEPILGEKLSASAMNRLASNSSIQDKLRLKMGKEGANEIIQIAKDLKLAKEEIKRIRAKDLKMLDKILPVAIFSPSSILGKVAGGAKIPEFARRAYGWYLTTPARRKALDEAAKALIAHDASSYAEAAKKLNGP